MNMHSLNAVLALFEGFRAASNQRAARIAALILAAALCAPSLAFDGACCITGGGAIFCQISNAKDCAALGGVFQGDGTTCDPFPCNGSAPIGACCASNGQSCFTSTEANCVNGGHTYLGDGSSCDPYPCPLGAVGACCLEDVQFCFVTDEFQCANFRGTFHIGAKCEDLDCGKIIIPATGACCVLGPFGQSCHVTSETACTSDGGTYFGDDTSCDPLPCDPGSGEVGACCIIGGGAIICSILHESHCIQLGGSFQGAGTNCDDLPCLPDLTGDCTYDDAVNIEDLLMVITCWGMTGKPGSLTADVNLTELSALPTCWW
jgi:hypothetical protein